MYPHVLKHLYSPWRRLRVSLHNREIFSIEGPLKAWNQQIWEPIDQFKGALKMAAYLELIQKYVDFEERSFSFKGLCT